MKVYVTNMAAADAPGWIAECERQRKTEFFKGSAPLRLSIGGARATESATAEEIEAQGLVGIYEEKP